MSCICMFGVSFMSCICMFGSIIYFLYLYVCEYHLCLVFVCLGVSFMSCICMFGVSFMPLSMIYFADCCGCSDDVVLFSLHLLLLL